MPDEKKTKKAKVDAPITAPVKRVGRPPKKRTYIVNVVCGTNTIELTFDNPQEFRRTEKQLAYNVKSGQPVTVTSGGTTYTFCKIDYMYR